MKWPKILALVRHGQSAYNVLRAQKEADPLFQQFRKAFEKDHRSAEARDLAVQVTEKFALGISDYNTPLTAEGVRQAKETGMGLSGLIPIPDIVFVSPYHRAKETFQHIKEEWGSAMQAKLVLDDRIREQEHGLSLLYNDWRVFQTLHPEQKDFYKMMGPYWYQFPQGESVSEVRDRVRLFIEMLIRECAGKNVLVVTHHLTILSIRANMERLSSEEFIHFDEHEKPINCGVTVYEGKPDLGTNGKLQLLRYNECLWKELG